MKGAMKSVKTSHGIIEVYPQFECLFLAFQNICIGEIASTAGIKNVSSSLIMSTDNANLLKTSSASIIYKWDILTCVSRQTLGWVLTSRVY